MSDRNNAVFTPERATSVQQPVIEIPTEIVPLPSNGKVYPAASTLHGMESIEIKSMTVKEENILTSQALAKKGTMLTELIRSCLVDKSVDPADMIVGDRYAILLAIRITGYGQIYSDQVECSSCGAVTKRDFDMSTFVIQRLDIEPAAVGENRFAFKLPRSGKIAEFRFLTGRDEENMHVHEMRMKKAGIATGNDNVTAALMRSIVSIDGNSDPQFLSRFIPNMSAGDSVALRDFMGKHQPGIKFTQTQVCPQPTCGHVEEVDMPMGLGFLWPNAQR